MMRHAQYSTTARIYQHVASEDMFAAAQAAQEWDRKGVHRMTASSTKSWENPDFVGKLNSAESHGV
jgi:hypothetical protein